MSKNAQKDIETSVKLEFTNNLFVFERKVTQQWSRDKLTYKGLKSDLLVNNAVSKNQATAINSLINYLGLADISNIFGSIPELAKLNLFELVYNANSLRTLDYKVIRAIITDMVGEVDFKELINENPEIWTPKLKKELYEACRTIIEHEDAFIDLAFEMGPMEGLTAQEVKDYIRFIANRRLTQLGLEPIYDVQKNPLTWLDTMLNAVEHMNFFEGRATEYSKASTRGSWGEVFA